MCGEHFLDLCSYGALDAKASDKTSFPSLEFTAVAGPTHDQHKPFKWSDTNIEGIPDFKPIDEFNFSPVRHKWTLADSVRERQENGVSTAERHSEMNAVNSGSASTSILFSLR